MKSDFNHAPLLQMHLFVGGGGAETEGGVIFEAGVFRDDARRFAARGLDELGVLERLHRDV